LTGSARHHYANNVASSLARKPPACTHLTPERLKKDPSMASVSLTALATLLVVSSSIVSTAHAQAPAGKAPAMVVQRNGTVPSAKGPEQFFSGPVRVDMLYQPQGPTRASVGAVTFEPGSRSAWHTHPLGQALIVTAGTGWVQEEGGTKIEMRPGDVIWCPPGIKHWHGATATTGVTHLAVTEALDGKNVQWMEKVSDEQYAAR